MARSGNLFPGCPVPLIPNDSIMTIVLMIITMTAGTGLVMWMGEQITARGVGNGMSLLIFTSIAAGFPSSFGNILSSQGIDIFLLVILVGLVIVALVVFVEQSHRRIPVQYAKRMVCRRMFGATSTYIPTKVRQAAVIPVN